MNGVTPPLVEQLDRLSEVALSLFRQDPRNPQAWGLLQQLVQAPLLSPATKLPLFDALRQVTPDDPSLLNDYACTLMQGKATDRAIEVFEALLARHPDLDRPRINLGIIFLEQARYDAAFECFSQVNDKEALCRMAAPVIARHIMTLGDPGRARMADVLADYLVLEPADPLGVLHGVMAALCLNRIDDARAILARMAEAVGADQGATDKTLSDMREFHDRLLTMADWMETMQRGEGDWPGFRPEADGAERQTRFVIPIAVWGDDYIAMMERYSLPSLLFPGNLPALASEGRVQVVVMTLEAHRERLEASPAIQAVRRVAPCDVVVVPSVMTGKDNPLVIHPYRMMSLMAYSVALHARRQGAWLLNWGPDIIASDGLLRHINEQRKAGFHLVFAHSVLGDGARIRQHLDTLPTGRVLDGQEILTLARDCPARWQDMWYCADKPIKIGIPLLWPTESGGFVSVQPLLPPYLVSPQKLEDGGAGLFFSNDTDWAHRLLATGEDVDRSNFNPSPVSGCFLELSSMCLDSPRDEFASVEAYARHIACLGIRHRVTLQPAWCDPAPFRADDSGWQAALAFIRSVKAALPLVDDASNPVLTMDWRCLWQAAAAR